MLNTARAEILTMKDILQTAWSSDGLVQVQSAKDDIDSALTWSPIENLQLRHEVDEDMRSQDTTLRTSTKGVFEMIHARDYKKKKLASLEKERARVLS